MSKEVIKIISVWCGIVWCALAVHSLLLVVLLFEPYGVTCTLTTYNIFDSMKPKTIFGVITLFSYIASLICAPFIILQLWRVQSIGRIGGLIFLANEIIYSLARNYILNTVFSKKLHIKY